MGFLRSLFFFCITVQGFSSADLVVFSYDRPLQLYAFLESVQQNVQGLDRQVVIFRVSSKAYEKAYKTVRKSFPSVEFREQDRKKPEKEFQAMVLAVAFDKRAEAKHLLFATDDCVVIRPIDLDDAVAALEDYGAYGVYFRLGLNIDQCYMTASYSGTPDGDRPREDLFRWNLHSARGDWAYCNNVDFTLYRKSDIAPVLEDLAFSNPNTMESKWAKCGCLGKRGICFLQSQVINIPLNTVAYAFNNRHMDWMSSAELLHHFVYGEKIDIAPLQGMGNRSPHVEVVPEFIKRS